ncbi:glycoside hydrolase family 28 protein [Novosphingobium terrae]|uniref:glycoside hydrolase family 28 protein n=1 Tax=Novosphingobium terrae TaxID=2726189 RepID=UPI00197FC0C2|nr:glycosyl hydrolase family 28 protein [Novosphingobium terrae]
MPMRKTMGRPTAGAPQALLSRRSFTLASLALWPANRALAAAGPEQRSASILDFGARPDGTTLNTKAIQTAIDHLAQAGGGTLIIPQGTFLSGALFLKSGVHLHLERGSTLKCTTDMANFPHQRTRIEGHFEEHFTPALINADHCHGLRITGEGVLDGSGMAIWEQFWALRKQAKDPGNFPNIGIDRARLALIQNSRDVLIEGVTFKDSQFWNLHLYACRNVTVRGARFLVPDDYAWAPSTDGIDLDSCQDVLVEGCFFSVTDDCIAAKGSKGPHALEDTGSPPVEHIQIRRCTFKRGHQTFSCGSEATVVRNVLIEDCVVSGAINVLMLKLRADTPQLYENIALRNIRLANEGGRIILIRPWTQYLDLKGSPPPHSQVRNVLLSGITGTFGAWGEVRPDPSVTVTGVRIEHVDIQLHKGDNLPVSRTDVAFSDVVVNGRTITAPLKAAI